jgi:hypothetical protein
VTLQLAHYIHAQQQRQFVTNATDQYGEQIAKLTADQVVSSLLNNDAISLQAIARNVSTQSVASSVIIYDLKHRILAQANNTAPETDNTHHHTSPVVSNNNIIGSVTIGISPLSLSSDTPDTLTPILTILLLITSIGIYIKGNKELTISTDDKPATNKKIEATPTVSTLAHEDTPKRVILLTLNIHNIDQLYQQLNAELRQQQFQELESNISHAVNLYGAKKISSNHNGLTLSIDGDIACALFTAELILRLNQHAKHSIIILNALMQAQESEESLLSTLDSTRKSIHSTGKQHCLFISRDLADKHAVKDKATLQDSNTPKILEVTTLKENHKNLLNKQLAQLQNNATN